MYPVGKYHLPACIASLYGQSSTGSYSSGPVYLTAHQTNKSEQEARSPYHAALYDKLA